MMIGEPVPSDLIQATAQAWNGARAVEAADATPTQRLKEFRVLALFVDGLTEWQVKAALDAGQTWQEIGDALGVTRQAAQQRYRHLAKGAT